MTRRNERRLQFSRTGWVRNGDRWTVTGVGRDQSLVVANARGSRITLPADYVRADVELGYATTIHGAQGATVDTMHGVLTGSESRQQLYTMMTRGRLVNHAYVQVVGDGALDSLPRWETARPPTPTEVLESVLARDDGALSATGLRSIETDPATQLKPAVDRYVDALGFAAEQMVGPERAAQIEADAERVVPELTDAPAWPVLRSQLMLLAASGADPAEVLRGAIRDVGLEGARDPAAVLSYRLNWVDRNGPLPWISTVPERLARHPQWGPYLASRSELVRDLAAQVREASTNTEHRWQEALSADLFPELVAQISVWRAAMGVPADDLSPTGPTQVPGSASRWQRALDDHVGLSSPTLRHWTAVARKLAPQLRDDPQTPVLAAKLASLSRDGEDIPELLERALRRGPLPDDHAAAALLYRLERRPRHEPIHEVWETVEFTESMGQRHERMRPSGIDRPHGYGIGI